MANFAEILYNIGMSIIKRTFLLILILLVVVPIMAQDVQFVRRFNSGTQLYNLGRFYEAAIEFRRAQELSANDNDWAASIYWVILSELACSDYGSALLDMAELERKTPNSIYNRDMTYHRARIYFNQGYFEDALMLFRRYIDSVTDTGPEAEHRKAAAYYWMGECLFAMGQYDDSQRFYSWVLQTFPESPKREISSYRIDLIKQKKIEAELLALLQWSHEGTLRTSEDYQRRLRTYEYTLNTYQRRIAELMQGGGRLYDDLPGDDYYIPPADFIDYVDIPLPETFTQEYHENLLNRAKQLGEDLEQLIRDFLSGGTW